MGSKKKAKHKKKAAKKTQKSKAVSKLRTPFMAAFTAAFIRDPVTKNQTFVVAGQTDPQVFQNFTTVLGVLGEQNSPLSRPVSGGTSSLRDKVIDFLNAQHWPDQTALPNKFKDKPRMVHLIEMAVIADRILQAINEGRGGAGDPSSWPPH